MTYRVSLLLLTFVCASFAQLPGPIRPSVPPGLRDYLQLTNEQVVNIGRLNAEYLQFSVQKQLRMAQVRREIIEWTNASPIEPMQLGIRYAEVEAIRRDLEDEQKRLQQKVFAVLNDVQKARVKVLEDASKLEPRINEAICANILAEPAPQRGIIGGILPALTIEPSSAVSSALGRCAASIVIPGDFLPNDQFSPKQ